AKNLFNRYRDNLTLVEINRLLNSNASRGIKNVASLLRDHIAKPNFSNFQDNFTLSQVREEPGLYQGCFVIWKGKITNLLISETDIRFTFLVGYHDEEELEGTLPTVLGFAANLSNGDNLEILAQLIFEETHLRLQGLSIHELD
ncbi:unnamed protein product, partial [marine sediment metagenome]